MCASLVILPGEASAVVFHRSTAACWIQCYAATQYSVMLSPGWAEICRSATGGLKRHRWPHSCFLKYNFRVADQPEIKLHQAPKIESAANRDHYL